MSLRGSLAAMAVASGFVSLATGAAYCGPDEITSRLMDEPASMLDFGILRLQIFLDSKVTLPTTGVGFDWEKNVVVISSLSFESQWTREQVEKACTDWFSSVRHIANVSPNTGELYFFTEVSAFSEMFYHYGFSKNTSGKTTDEVAAEMDKKFSLIYSWFSDNSEKGEVSSIVCTGPLLDSGFSLKVETVK